MPRTTTATGLFQASGSRRKVHDVAHGKLLVRLGLTSDMISRLRLPPLPSGRKDASYSAVWIVELPWRGCRSLAVWKAFSAPRVSSSIVPAHRAAARIRRW